MRDGTHWGLVLDEPDIVIAEVTGIDLSRATIDGQKKDVTVSESVS